MKGLSSQSVSGSPESGAGDWLKVEWSAYAHACAHAHTYIEARVGVNSHTHINTGLRVHTHTHSKDMKVMQENKTCSRLRARG